jgi:hypothetical protein
MDLPLFVSQRSSAGNCQYADRNLDLHQQDDL